MELYAGIAQFPDWLPDETVYSWASRFHTLAGHRLPSQTSQVVFGGARRGAQHDLPTGLAAFAERTRGRLGSAQEIALTRTVLGYYLAARTESESSLALAALSGSTAQGLKFRLGMLTSRFRANHPLKACPSCMAEDKQAYGVSYWHLTHQYPGTWICLRHCAPLLAASIKSNGVARFGWILPEAAGLQAPLTGEVQASSLARFANLVQGWTLLPAGSLSVQSIAAICRRQLSRSGTMGRTTSRMLLAEAYANSLAPLRAVPELAALPATTRAAQMELDRWLFAPRGNTHPLRLLALIGWLFAD